MNQNASCRLCGKNSKLLKKSHIIPNFMYKGIKDDSNRMILAKISSLEDKGTVRQTGYFEKYILCSKCDNEIIGKLERYVSLVLFGGGVSSVPTFENAIGPDGVRSIIIKNIDYSKLKLCLLSILWRAHISKDRFFRKVDIKNNAERIRQMLLNNDPGDESEFKISIIGVKNHEGPLRMVIDPSVFLVGKGQAAMFFINGFFYFIDLIPPSDFTLFKEHFLTKSGNCEIMLLDGQQGWSLMSAIGLPDYVVNYYFK